MAGVAKGALLVSAAHIMLARDKAWKGASSRQCRTSSHAAAKQMKEQGHIPWLAGLTM